MKRLIFIVTNDLNYDQRMQRICTTLSHHNFSVLLVGRKMVGSLPLQQQYFEQKRLACIFGKGAAFYIEFNMRLLFFLLFARFDAVCAIDLDTIIPCYLAAKIKRKQKVYDAHEWFTQQKEILTRKWIHKCWLKIERSFVPLFTSGYTVNDFISTIFKTHYGVEYEVIRNLPVLYPLAEKNDEPFYILYQGSVNEGRCFETLVPAMKKVNAVLWVCGEGNYFKQLQTLIDIYGLGEKIILKGAVLPSELKQITQQAIFALTLFEPVGQNQYHSLCNRFFDYIMAGIPQLCVGYPEYRTINEQFEVALLIDSTDSTTIASGINKLLHNPSLREKLRTNTIKAREILNWNREQKKLVDFWTEKMKTCSDT